MRGLPRPVEQERDTACVVGGTAMGSSTSSPLAVVTGASSGIGLELARQFAEHGYTVIMAAEDGRLASAAAEIRGSGAAVTPVQVDLASSDGVEELFGVIRDHPLPVESLALNAGVGVGGPFVETPWASDRDLLELNVVSVVHLAKLVIPRMVERGAGRVLMTASVQSAMPGPYYATYAAS